MLIYLWISSNYVLGKPEIHNKWNILLHVNGVSTVLAHFSSGWDESEYGEIVNNLNKRFGFRKLFNLMLIT